MAKGRKHSDYTKSLISNSVKGSNNPFFNSSHSTELKIAISQKKSTGIIYIYNSLFELQIIVPSITKLCREVNSIHQTIQSYILSKNLFRGEWYFTNKIFNSSFSNNIAKYNYDFTLQSNNTLLQRIKDAHTVRKAVFVFDYKFKNFIKRYDGVMQCAKDIKISHNTINNVIKTNKQVGIYIFSSHRILNSI